MQKSTQEKVATFAKSAAYCFVKLNEGTCMSFFIFHTCNSMRPHIQTRMCEPKPPPTHPLSQCKRATSMSFFTHTIFHTHTPFLETEWEQECHLSSGIREIVRHTHREWVLWNQIGPCMQSRDAKSQCLRSFIINHDHRCSLSVG